MADNKLSWTELRKALASRAGTNEREAKLFLDALNEQIAEGLRQDKHVRINGIGTFRMQSVAPRRSVNISTGESITIEGYEKVVFTPEAGVKELIEHNTLMKKKNKKAAEVINPLEKLDEQATEIVGILNDLGQSPKEGENKQPAEKKEPEEAASEPVKAETNESVAAETPKPVAAEEPAKPAEKAKPVAPTKPFAPAKPVAKAESKKPQEEKAPKKSHFVRDTLICVIILLMLLLVGYFFLRHQISGWLDSLSSPAQTEQKAPKQTFVIENVNEKPAAPQKEAVKEIVYDKLITTEEMHQDSRLAWMAWRYYGNKAFWVYLYDANKDHIVNPDKIVTGTPIRVPKLTKEQMDTTLESTRATLQRLTEQGEAAKLR